jgi:hypothetical protein
MASCAYWLGLEPFNGDVLVEMDLPSWYGAASAGICVMIVNCGERIVFGDDLEAARDYARREARRRGTRALERAGSTYVAIPL